MIEELSQRIQVRVESIDQALKCEDKVFSNMSMTGPTQCSARVNYETDLQFSGLSQPHTDMFADYDFNWYDAIENLDGLRCHDDVQPFVANADTTSPTPDNLKNQENFADTLEESNRKKNQKNANARNNINVKKRPSDNSIKKITKRPILK